MRDVAQSTEASPRVGATEEAKAAFSWLTAAVRPRNAMLAARGGNLGLPGGEVDPDDSRRLGNMPQALSQLALIHAAATINEGSG